MRTRTVKDVWDRYHHIVDGHEERSKWSKYQFYPTPKVNSWEEEEKASRAPSMTSGPVTSSRRYIEEMQLKNAESARNFNFICGMESLLRDCK